MRNVGVVARGIRGPIIRPGDNLVKIVADSLSNAIESDNIVLHENDILGITEAVVAKAQQNFAYLGDIKKEIETKYKNEIGIVFPILSRNRFSNVLKGIAMGVDKVYIQLSYPSDEVGNKLITQEKLDETDVNPYTDVLTEEEFFNTFGETKHEYTGVDYIKLYNEMCEGKATIIFSNNPATILNYTEHVLVADIHTRHRTKSILKKAGAKTLYGLDDLLTKSINDSGYNSEFGLLGSNLSSSNRVKLFPRDCDKFVLDVQKELAKRFKVKINILIYGDGCFKDSVEGIWELADPVVSPGYTKNLMGLPNEIKLKYVADNSLGNLSQDDAQRAIKKMIRDNPKAIRTDSHGTTPRKITDLLGSLCDLMSGSGDKGTPFVLIQGYFDNYAD